MNSEIPAILLLSIIAFVSSIVGVDDPFTLDNKLEHALNDQILAEYEAFYMYEYMGAYFSRPEIGLMGFAKFFHKMATEEIEHARKFTEFVNKRNSKVVLKNILLSSNDSPMQFENVHGAIRLAIDKELLVSQRVNGLHKLATNMNDPLAQDFLDGFLKEQMESVAELRELYARLKLDQSAVFLLDRELR